MRTPRTLSRSLRFVRLLCVAVIAALVLVPATALADDKDYSLAQTVIWATVEPDGDLSVLEERAVDLEGNFHGFFWEIPTASSELGDATIDVVEAGEVDTRTDTLVPYTHDDTSGAEGTWSLKQSASSTRVDVHYDKTDVMAYFYVNYVLHGATARWADTGELYWKFVGDKWDRPSRDVTCHVLFAGAPAGEEVTPGDNLRGWLHNASLAGEIKVPDGTVPGGSTTGEANTAGVGDAGTLRMDLSAVRSGEFAEVRAAFPTSWISGAKAHKGERLERILSEEDGWAREANARQGRARTAGLGGSVLLAALAAITAIASVATWLRFRATHKASFDDKYFRDVPTDDHPAVLHYVCEDEAGAGPDFTASLMRLTDAGVIRLEKATYLKKRLARSPKEVEDWRLVLVGSEGSAAAAMGNNAGIPTEVSAIPSMVDTPAPTSGTGADASAGGFVPTSSSSTIAAAATASRTKLDPIDEATLSFVFDYVAQHAQTLKDDNERPYGTLFMSDFERVARKEEDNYVRRLENWKDVVVAEVEKRGLNKGDEALSSSLALLFVVDGIAAALAFAAVFFFSDYLSFGGALLPVIVLGAALAIVLVVCATAIGRIPKRSAEATEIKAKMDALTRWLRDFTRLGEAVPTDVVLWNRLLVAAVVLGVADKVIDQLRVAVPQLIEDTALASTVMWCDTSTYGTSPAESFSSGFSSASSAASSEGSGGGASGGGGGGAGGGGGGAY